MHLGLFIAFAVICVAGAINLVAQRHPINSALSLILVMGSLAVLYLLLGAEFVAAIQLIVYAGAIMVLFVFVIMLLNAGEEEHTRGSKVAMGLGIPAVLVVAAVLLSTEVARNPAARDHIPIGAMYGSPVEIGQQLFREFLLPFEVTSILILIAIMGAVLLARYHAVPPPPRALDPDEHSELLEIAGGHGSATSARERARQQRESKGQEVAR